jgi:hypothetical protein
METNMNTIEIPTDGRPLTITEAAAWLRLDTMGVADPVQAVMRYHKQKRLKGSRVGRTIVFSLKSLHAFLDAQANGSDNVADDEPDRHVSDENL